MIILFPSLLTDEMYAHVAAGGQAAERWDKSYTYGPNAPKCFRGRDFVKLYDQDAVRLAATARRLGVRVIHIDRAGQRSQHIDLVGRPMANLLAEAVPYQPPVEPAPS